MGRQARSGDEVLRRGGREACMSYEQRRGSLPAQHVGSACRHKHTHTHTCCCQPVRGLGRVGCGCCGTFMAAEPVASAARHAPNCTRTADDERTDERRLDGDACCRVMHDACRPPHTHTHTRCRQSAGRAQCPAFPSGPAAAPSMDMALRRVLHSDASNILLLSHAFRGETAATTHPHAVLIRPLAQRVHRHTTSAQLRSSTPTSPPHSTRNVSATQHTERQDTTRIPSSSVSRCSTGPAPPPERTPAPAQTRAQS